MLLSLYSPHQSSPRIRGHLAFTSEPTGSGAWRRQSSSPFRFGDGAVTNIRSCCTIYLLPALFLLAPVTSPVFRTNPAPEPN
jgi:hypothetical protein